MMQENQQDVPHSMAAGQQGGEPTMQMPVSEKAKKKNIFKIDASSIPVILAIIAIVIVAVIMFTGKGFWGISSLSSKQAVAQSAIDYLNKNILQQGQTATLGDVSQESGVIKMQVKIGGNSYDSYVTADGKLFFPQAYQMGQAASSGSNNQNGGQTSQVDSKQVVADGRPFVGSANAPVVMAYWYDYQCPFCKKNEQDVTSQLVKDYVDTGKLKIVFKQYAFLGNDSTTAALAEKAVWEIAPNKFYAWHKAMFDKQDGENSGWGSRADVLALTQSLGIDSAKVDQLMTSKAAAYQKLIDDDKAEGTKFGVNGTPAAIIGSQVISGAQSYSTFKADIDALLK